MQEPSSLTRWATVGRSLLHGLLFGVFLGALEPYMALYLTSLLAHLATRTSVLHLITASLILNMAVCATVAVVAALLYRFWSFWKKKVPTARGTIAACWAAFAVVLVMVLFSGYLNPRFGIAPSGTWRSVVLRGLLPLVAVAFAVVVQHWLVRQKMRLGRLGGGLAVVSLALSLGLVQLLFGVVGEPFRGQSWRKVDPSLTRAPNIVVIMLDTLRADHLSAYGYERRTSPQLERLAKEGVLFENAFAHSNWTPPSTTTLLTSLYESVHGVNRENISVPDTVTTVAEALGRFGYTSGFWSANGLVSIEANYSKDFDYAYQLSDAYQDIRERNRLPVSQLYVWRLVNRLSQQLYPNWENNPMGSAPFPPFLATLKALNASLEHLFNEVGVDKKVGFDQTNVTKAKRGGWVRPIKTFDEGYFLRNARYRAQKADWMHKNVRAYLSYMTARPGYDPRRNKFFLYLHYFDPHAPYRPPPRYRRVFDPNFRGRYVSRRPGGKKMCQDGGEGLSVSKCYADNYWETRTEGPLDNRSLRNMVAQYDGEILFLDHFLGKLVQLLKKKGLFENTLLVITSDHGEAFYEHKTYGHGNNLYQEEVHIPLIVTWPRGLSRGVRLSDPVGLVDIMPTVLEAVGVPAVPCMQGRSLLGVIRGTEHRKELYGETAYHNKAQVFLVRDHRKIIYVGSGGLRLPPQPQPQSKYLFDLKADPGEKLNLLAGSLDPATTVVVKSMQGALDRWYKVVRQACRFHKPTEAEMSPELEKRLKALGYVN